MAFTAAEVARTADEEDDVASGAAAWLTRLSSTLAAAQRHKLSLHKQLSPQVQCTPHPHDELVTVVPPVPPPLAASERLLGQQRAGAEGDDVETAGEPTAAAPPFETDRSGQHDMELLFRGRR